MKKKIKVKLDDNVKNKKEEPKKDIDLKKTSKKIISKTKKLLKNIKKDIDDSLKLEKDALKRTITSAVILAIVVIFGLMAVNKIMDSNSKNVSYPIVYEKSNGDMYLLQNDYDVKTKESIDKMQGTGYVIYANNTKDYVLFRNELDLYIYDVKKQESSKISDDATSSYGFSTKDSYVYTVDSDMDLYAYNYKEAKQLLDNTITNIVDFKDKSIIYEKNTKLNYVSFDPSKEDRTVVVEGYQVAELSENEKYVIYTNANATLYRYNIRKQKHEKIADNVNTFYCDDSSCKKIYYTVRADDYTLNYYNGNKSVEIVSGLYNVEEIDVENEKVIYSVMNNNKLSVYYKKGNSKAVKITNDFSYESSLQMLDDEIYYTNSNDDLMYVKIKGSKLGKSKKISEGIQGQIEKMSEGIYFYKNINENRDATYYIAKKGKTTKVADDIRITTITLSNDETNLYYMKDIVKESGILYAFDGKTNTKISEDVYLALYIRNDAVYYIKDYNNDQRYGTLYKYDGKNTEVEKNVSYLAQTPNAPTMK